MKGSQTAVHIGCFHFCHGLFGCTSITLRQALDQTNSLAARGRLAGQVDVVPMDGRPCLSMLRLKAAIAQLTQPIEQTALANVFLSSPLLSPAVARWGRFLPRSGGRRGPISVHRLAAAIGPTCLWILVPLSVVQQASSRCRRSRRRSARTATAFLCGRRKTAGRAP